MLIPPKPEPLSRERLGLIGFLRSTHSWLDALTVKSYSMLLGHFWLPAFRVFVINDPVWVERMLVTEPERYPKHRLMHATLEPILGLSPFATNGAIWQRQRRMLDQAFGAARLGLVFPLMQQACEDMLGRMGALFKGAGTEPVVLEADVAMTQVTADIVYRAIFGEALEMEEAAKLFDAFAEYQTLSQKCSVLMLFRLPLWWYDGARKRKARVIRDFLAEKIRQRYASRTLEEEQKGADLLAGLRLAVDPEDGSALTETEVLDQICILFMAGHETSASSLGWSLYLLGESPELQERLRAEIEAAAPGRPLQLSDLRSLPRLQSMFREVLRLYPPVGAFPREAAEDQVIRGAKVRKGDALMVVPWLLHRHKRWWMDPDAFEPDRFVNDTKGGGPRGAYIPFGMGARVCIGAGFAMQEVSLILASLLRTYRMESVGGPPPRVVGRLTVRSDKGLRVRLQPLARG